MATAVAGYVVPATILPANLPNAVLLGADDALYGIQITYGQYLLFNFPVNGALLDPASPGHAFEALSFLAASTGLFATMPGIVTIMSPLAGELAGATGFPLITVLMTIVNGYTLVAFPYQVGPIVFALMLGGGRFRDAARLLLPLLVVSSVALIPLTDLWWRLLGYVG